MRVVKGNKISDVDTNAFSLATSGFTKCVLDLGTGDGRFVYESALDNPDNFYVGVDPSQKQMEIYSRKAVRKNMRNVMFVVGSIEVFPEELLGAFDEVHINLPWGSLLQNIILPTPFVISLLRKILKDKGDLHIIVGYTQQAEPSETTRLGLPDEITESLLAEKVVPSFLKVGFKLKHMKEIERASLKSIKTTWAKKLTFGQERPIFLIELTV